MSRPPTATTAPAPLRLAKWLALASACALPLAMLTYTEFGGIERCAGAAGIVTWAALLARIEPRLAASRPGTWTRSCTFGFAAWAVVQGVVALFAVNGSEVLQILGLSLYLLALVPFFLVALLGQVVIAPLLLLFGRDSRLAEHLILGAAVFVATLLCGLPNLAGGMFATNLIDHFRRGSTALPRQRRGPTGIERTT